MYVLADLEWFEDKTNRICFTQISMRRVYDRWSSFYHFYRRIQPLPSSFPNLSHVSFTGGSSSAFLKAPNEEQVFQELKRWLWPSDIICWWKSDALELFKKRVPSIANKQVTLSDLVANYLEDDPHKTPYQIGISLSLELLGPEHDAKNDTEMMRRVLERINFPQPIPEYVPNLDKYCGGQDLIQTMAYHLHTPTNIIHKNGCPQTPNDGQLKGYDELTGPVGLECIPCDCVKSEFLSVRKLRNLDIIDRSEYCFVYSPDSKVFHRRGCSSILYAKTVLGAVYYKTCIKAQRQPCKKCKPSTEHETLEYLGPKSKGVVEQIPKRNVTLLSPEEERAVKRHRQALEKRTAVENNPALTQEQHNDQCMLSTSSYSYFAAKGYRTFHLRHCRKLSGLSNLKGFALYEDAVKSRHRPCKICKPDPKYDITISVPIYSISREDDETTVLEELCRQYGFVYRKKTAICYIETPFGIWRIHIQESPYRVDHINLIKAPDNRTEFHRQPRLFLSLQDVFYYIKRHDCDDVSFEWKDTEYVPQEAAR